MKEMEKISKESDANVVPNPENHEVESTGILAVHEVKNPPPPKRKKSVTAPIAVHEGKSKKKRQGPK